MSYGLSSLELRQLLLNKIMNKSILDPDLNEKIDDCNYWSKELSCITFSLARILEGQRDEMLLNRQMISKLFKLPTEMFFSIEECDHNFIDYMLRNEYVCGDDLELSLLAIKKRYSEYKYDKRTLRY